MSHQYLTVTGRAVVGVARFKRRRWITCSAASLTVTSDYYGKCIRLTYEGAVAVTLPAAAEQSGAWFMALIDGSDSCEPTFSTPDVDTLITFNNQAADSITFATGERIGALVLFISTGSLWVAINLSGAQNAMTVTDA